MPKKRAKSKRLRVDIYPPVSTKLKAAAKADGDRSVSNLAAKIIDAALPDRARALTDVEITKAVDGIAQDNARPSQQ